MKIQLIRHAAMKVSFNGYNLLVDPMLSAKGTMPAVENSPEPRCNPLVGIPDISILENIHAVLISHTHRDHFDEQAAWLLPKNIPFFCQPCDEQKIREYGFIDIRPVNEKQEWQGISIFRTGGQHGTGEIGKKMGKVSGFALKAAEEQVLYIAGDTVWCPEVKAAIKKYKPTVTVVFAGAAQFLIGQPITMTAEDVEAVCRFSPEIKVIAVHMEAFNHCLLTRQQLRDYARTKSFSHQLYIPEDGQEIDFDITR